MLFASLVCMSCQTKKGETPSDFEADTFAFVVDRFADIEIMRYRVDNWDDLTLKQKELIYYLSEATRCGRDIIFDQNCKYNLQIRNVLDVIISNYTGDKTCENWEKFIVYAKRFWFSNGMHHHYAGTKFFPECPQSYFSTLLDSTLCYLIPNIQDNAQEIKKLQANILNIIYNPTIAPIRICQDTKKDLVTNSAVNFYENISQKEVEKFYDNLRKNNTADAQHPLSYGLNSKIVKKDGQIQEQVYCIGGLYSSAIEQIVYWLQKASEVAENDQQKEHILKLIEYYQTGDLKIWDDYNILWVKDLDSEIDYVNGFIEVYGDPLGQKGTWEGLVNFKDKQSCRRTDIIEKNAQWFEDNSPIDNMFKKKEVKGVAAKAIIVAQLGGDCYPATPIGINLPNANWIRKEYGSKSVTIENLMYAYHKAAMKNGVLQSFYFSQQEIDWAQKYGYLTDKLQVDLHECLGHGSGQMLAGVNDAMLKNYHSVIEEARADLFSLYFIGDPQMVALGLLPDTTAYKAIYYKYIINAKLLQNNRIELNQPLTEAHMQNRALIANWCIANDYDHEVFDLGKREEKTYIYIKDYTKLRQLFAKLLANIQKIKSTGDYDAARTLVQEYAVKIDPKLHKEVKERYATLNIAPYSGFLNPDFEIQRENGKIIDIRLIYPTNFVQQMMEYDAHYHFINNQLY